MKEETTSAKKTEPRIQTVVDNGEKWHKGHYSENYRQGEISMLKGIIKTLKAKLDYYEDRGDVD